MNQHLFVVDIYWNKHISRRKKDPYHLRLWREQPVKGPAVERTAGRALTADRSGNICVTFSDGGVPNGTRWNTGFFPIYQKAGRAVRWWAQI